MASMASLRWRLFLQTQTPNSLKRPFNNQHTGELHSTPTAHKGKTNYACQEPRSFFKTCKFLTFRTATISGKTPPCHSHQQSKKPLLWQCFLCYWCFEMHELENKTSFIMPIRAFECYSDLWVTTKSPFCSQSTSQPYIQITTQTKMLA